MPKANAALDVDALSIEALLTKSNDSTALKNLTARINANAAAIAASEAGVAKVVNVGR